MNAAPVGGGGLIIPAGDSTERQEAAWMLIKSVSNPDIAGQWSRLTGYFARNRGAYESP